MRDRSIWSILLSVGIAVGVAAAEVPMPSLKPAAPVSPYVSPADEAILRAVFGALDDRRYELADALRRDLSDPVSRSVADWAYLRSNAESPSPEEYGAFLAAHPNWPQADAIQRKAEDLLTDATDPARIIAFFDTREPVSGQGKLQLGRALYETGSEEAGADMIRRAWVEHSWTAGSEREILSRYGARLRPRDHVAKADAQLFDIEATNTERLLPLLPDKARAEATARIAFLKRDPNAPALYAALPEASRRDPGVLHAATRYHRRMDDDGRATELAGLAPLDGESLRDPDAWFAERKLLARTALKEGRFEDAYVLSAYSGLERGADFAEAEFMAGWVALRFLRDPERARAHFAYLTTGVTSPISLARGHYWLARATEAAGESAEADRHYRAAAAYPYAYYGQLAAERLSEAVPEATFPAPEAPDAEALTVFESRPMVHAMHVLAEIGEDWAFDRFARALDDQLNAPGEVLAYGDLVMGQRKPWLAVRAGKVARGNGASAPQVTYPDHPVPEAASAFVEAPLILGLSRQESEFNPRAYSSAKARGLMQLLASTARITARKEGLPYDVSRLMDDPDYNMTIGAAHLSHLLERFEGSYVMVLAGYNAGPHRVDQWVETYGDPRDPSVDPIDWVELIPFSETRNYVMRVLENTQIYRARMRGSPIAGQLTTDITRGGADPGAIGKAVPAPMLSASAAGDRTAESLLNVPGESPVAIDRASFPLSSTE